MPAAEVDMEEAAFKRMRINLRRVQEPSIRDESVGTLVLADFRGKDPGDGSGR